MRSVDPGWNALRSHHLPHLSPDGTFVAGAIRAVGCPEPPIRVLGHLANEAVLDWPVTSLRGLALERP